MDPYLPAFRAKQDTAVVPFFFMHEGEECVKVQIAGETRFAPVFRVTDMWIRDGLEEITYKDRWAEQYAQFKGGFTQVSDGTPLEEAPFLNPSRIGELRQLKIYSLESLASLDDRMIPRLGGKGYELKHLAQEWLAKRTREGADSKVAEMQAQIAELMARLDAQNTDAPDDAQEKMVLKDAIKVKTGKYPAGNPSLKTLQGILAELNEAAA